MSKKFDVVITGQMGLYGIRAVTPKGRSWVKKHLSGGERTRLGGELMCEGGDRCRDIVGAMDVDGVHVSLNGVDMKGFSKTRR